MDTQNPILIWVKIIFIFFLSTISAFSLSFAADLLLGEILRVYPSTAFLPVVTWSIISGLSLILVVHSPSNKRLLALPWLVFGSMALLGGIVGHHYSLVVSAALFIEGFMMWFLEKRSDKKQKLSKK